MCGFIVVISNENPKFIIPEDRIENSLIEQLVERSDSKRTITKYSSRENNNFFYSLHGHLSISNQKEYIKYPLIGSSSKLIFNGEIYSIDGIKFKNSNFFSDGHMLLQYLEENFKKNFCYSEIFKSISGQYGFVYLNKEGKVLIARDLYGQKPIYKFHNENYLIIASNQNLLLTYLLKNFPISNKNSFSKRDENIKSLYGLEKFPNIEKLNPGSLEIFDIKKSFKKSFSYCIYKSNFLFDNKSLIFKSIDDIEESFSNSLDSIIPNENYCLALSSGFDSNNILFSIDKYNLKPPKQLLTIKSRNNSKELNHCHLASEFTKNSLKVINPKFDLPRSLYAQINYDGANACINALANECSNSNCKILITGDGGDEISFRYRRSNYINIIKKLPEEIRQLFSPFLCTGKLNLSTVITFKAFLDKELPNFSNFYELVGINDNDLKIKGNKFLAYIYEMYLHLPEHILNKSDIISYLNKIEMRSPYLTNEFGLKALISNMNNPNKYQNYSKILNNIFVPKVFQSNKKFGLSA